MVNAVARATIGDQRKGFSRTYRPSQALSESIVHNIADGQVPLGCSEFRLSQEIVVYYKCGAHMCDHTYARKLRQLYSEHGAIAFPSRYAQGYAYLRSKVYGDRPGHFMGDEDGRDPQANYLTGYGRNRSGKVGSIWR